VPDCLAPWKREVKQRAATSSQLLVDLVRQVRNRMSLGVAPPSFTKSLWEQYHSAPGSLSEREIAYATGSLFGAGSDTSSATLTSFILAMTCFPLALARAQEELDRVVGSSRLPTWSDEPNLPYCAAVIKETLRWRPVAVMGGTPHASIRDDFYQGLFIPKGTTILGNLWAIHHNEKYFRNSQEFIPERYLSPASDEGTEPYPHKDGHSAFGWVSYADTYYLIFRLKGNADRIFFKKGRRICPGKKLAENSLFISIVRILWGFNIEKACDPITGVEMVYNTYAYTDGFNSKPQPFRCVITPRSEEFRGTIEREAEEGRRFLEKYDWESECPSAGVP
jgi:cytochrome P450